MFEALSDRFEGVLGRLKGKGKLTEADIDDALREIRLALLEADVNFTVVKNFVARVRERCLGQELSGALNPGQQVVKIVNDELTATLGGETIRITYSSKPPTVVLMAGLQGSGKTTNSAKLARWFKSQGRHPLLVGADLQRPAAVEQLRTLGRQIEVPVFSEATDPVAVAAAGIVEARKTGRDVVIVDTAGRLAIDAELMDEVRRISEAVDPNYTFLVIDAMTGQDAVSTAEAFHQTLELDGVILTKLDGDARGGAALSVKEVVGRPIAFASTGEKLKDFDLFHPDRLAGRILGMGDMLTLIEKAEEVFEKDQAEAAAARLMEGQFTFDDFLDQMQQLKKMGPLSGVLGMMPGVPKEVRNARDRRQGDRPGRGHHPVDDHRRARRPRPDRPVAPGPHRQGLGHRAGPGAGPRLPVQGDVEDDEADGRHGLQAHRQVPPQGRQGQGEGPRRPHHRWWPGVGEGPEGPAEAPEPRAGPHRQGRPPEPREQGPSRPLRPRPR